MEKLYDEIKPDSHRRKIKYECTNCGAPTPKSKLTVKRVQYMAMGMGAKVERSRVIAWLCAPCVLIDPDYNREPYKTTPGFEDVET